MPSGADHDGDSASKARRPSVVSPRAKKAKNLSRRGKIEEIKECPGSRDNEQPSTSRGATATSWHSIPTRVLGDRGTDSGPAAPRLKRKLDDSDEECDESMKKLRSHRHWTVVNDINEDPPMGEGEKTTIRTSKYDNRDTYPGSGLKRSLHGTVYQLKHLMLVVHRVWKKGYSFCLSTEMDAAGKFDDLVLEFEDDTGNEVRRFVQFKHKDDENQTITTRQLLDIKDGDFSVLKYFLSWRKINGNPNFGRNGLNVFILCTNIDIGKGIHVEVVQESDEFLEVTGRETQPPRYKLLVEEESELWDVLKSASELHQLASELAKRIYNSKPIDLRTDIFKDYHIALAAEVINIESKKFFEDFSKNKEEILSPNVQKFRRILFENLQRLSQQDMTPEEFEEYLNKCEPNLSGTFGKKFQPPTQPQLTDVDEFCQRFVRLLNDGAEKDNVVEIKRQKRANDPFPERVFYDNIDMLAGHVLILEAGNIRFRQQFLEGDDTHLAGNIGEFKAALKRISFNGLSDFGKFKFKIYNFKTCTEEELSLKTELPDDYIDDDEIKRFYREFILAVRQPNERELGTMIKQEIGAYSQFNLLNADFIKDSFQNEILDWFKKTGKECEFLKNKDADAFFDNMETKLSSLITIGLNAPYPAELEEFNIRYKSEISDLRDFLDGSSRTRKPILELISPKPTLLTALRVYQTLAEIDSYKKKDSYIFLHLDKFLLPKIESQVLTAFESRGSHDLLVIDCELISAKNAARRRIAKLWNGLEKVVTRNPSKRIILIIQEDADSTSEFEDDSEIQAEKDDEVGINNLDGYSLKKILEKKVVNFQGRVNKTSFADLLNIHDVENRETENLTVLRRIIDPNTLVQIIRGEEIRIGSEIRGLNVEDYYVDRTIFRHVMIRAEILKAPGIPDLFAFSGIDKKALENLVNEVSKQNVFRQSGEIELPSDEYVILENGREKEHFLNLCEQYSSRNVHWLEGKTGKFIWKETFGNTKSLVQFEEEHRVEGEHCEPNTTYLTQDQLFIDDNQPRIIILSGVAGMGKSTLLNYVGGVLKRKPNMLVIRIDLNRFTDELEKRQANRSFESKNIDEAVDFLVDELSNPSGETRLAPNGELLKLNSQVASETYKAMIKGRGEVVLLFDGFDEIFPNYARTVAELLRVLAECPIKKLFVTSRPHSKKLLERKLGTLPYVMQPFNRENQMEYLINYWRKGLSSENDSNQDIEKLLRERAAKVIELLKRSINIQMQEFTGIPLQTWLVANGFPYGKGETLPETIDIVGLYQQFIDEKYRILFSEKKPGKGSNIVEDEMRQITRETYMKRHEKLAVVALFDGATVKALFPSESVVSGACRPISDGNEYEERTGIVKNGKPVEFIHRTFAEYFAAAFLHKTLIDDQQNQQVREFFVSQLLLKPEYKTIRAFLNCFLTRTSNALDNENKSWGFGLRGKRNAAGQTLFHIAVEERNVGILTFFLLRFRKHKSVTHSNTDNVNTQKEAFDVNNWNAVDLADDHRADIDLEDESDQTPLDIAISYHDHCILKCLVEGGIDLNNQRANGETLLHTAVTCGNFYAVKCFVEKGADINCQAGDIATPLHISARYNYFNIIKYLVEKRADIDCPAKDGRTPLHIAAEFDDLEVVEYFVKNGANIHRQDENGKTPLHIAIKSRNWDVFKYLVKQRADIFCQDIDGQTPLDLAAQFTDKDVFKYLVDNGAKIDGQAEHDVYPLHVAALRGNLGLIESLVKKGADIHWQDENGYTSLHYGAVSGEMDVVEYLVGKSADFNLQDKNGETPLHIAARYGNFDMVKYFVEKGADVNRQDEDGETLLHIVAESGEKDLVEYLVGKSADLNIQDNDGETPLHIAARSGNFDMVKYFVEKGADVDRGDEDGETLLHIVAESGEKDLVEYLVGKSADLNLQDKDGETPLHIAARSGNFDMVKSLDGKGADVNLQEKNGKTPLHTAVGYAGNLDVVKYFVAKGAAIDCEDKNGNTPLHYAPRSGDLDIVTYLVGEGADIHSQDKDGGTPLHVAAAFGQLDIVKYFNEKGADMNCQASNNRTPLLLAVEFGKVDVVEYLVEKGININCQYQYGQTLLHIAAEYGKIDVVKYLVKKGADINLHDGIGETPLHTAAGYDYLDIVKYFVDEAGADKNCRDKDNKTPLHIAAVMGYSDVVEYFVEKGVFK